MGLPPGGKRGVMEQGGQIGVVCSELNLESCFPLRACFLLIRWECRDLSTTTTTTCTHMRSLVSKGMARVADPAQGCFFLCAPVQFHHHPESVSSSAHRKAICFYWPSPKNLSLGYICQVYVLPAPIPPNDLFLSHLL